MTWPRFLALALCAVPFGARGEDDAIARSLAATCANCYGTEGRSASRELPSLAGMSKEKIAADLRAFKSGARPATVMHQLARGYTDAQIDLVAAYFGAGKN